MVLTINIKYIYYNIFSLFTAPDWNIESIYKRKAIIVKIKNPTGPLMRDLEGGYIHHEASILDNASVHMGDGDFAPVVQESRV